MERQRLLTPKSKKTKIKRKVSQRKKLKNTQKKAPMK